MTRSIARRRRQHTRVFSIEQLEVRDLLTRVVEVEIGSTEWDTGMMNYLQTAGLGTRGISIPSLTEQSKPLTWSNLNQVAVTFDGPVTVTEGHLVARGLTGDPLAFSGFSYDTGSHVAMWAFDEYFANDRILLDLDGDSLTPVAGEDGLSLDGEWLNNAQDYPSGDGAAGGDFEFTFSVLPGNADTSDTQLGLADFRLLKDNFGVEEYGHPADFDGSGRVGLEDFRFVKDHFGNSLPGGNHFEFQLQETAGFATTVSFPVEIGQQSGSRLISLALDTQFDTTDTSTSLEDRLLISLVGPTSGEVLLGNGPTGTAVFSLSGNEVEFDPTIVQYTQGVVHVDVSTLSPMTEALVRVQLLNFDHDTQGQATIRLLGNLVDPDNEVSEPLTPAVSVVSPGSPLDTSTLAPAPLLMPEITQLYYDNSSTSVRGTLFLRNGGAPVGRQNVVVVDGLPAGASLQNASGLTTDGKPYLNITNAVQRGGLVNGAVSELVAFDILNPGNNALPLLFSVLTGAPNGAPAFDSIPGIAILPGDVQEIQLVASDADGDPVTFEFGDTSTLPGATLTSGGRLRLAPTPAHLGTHSIELRAFDGAVATSQFVEIVVNPDPITTTRVSGVIENTDQQPLVNVPIELGGALVLTDANGHFQFEFPGSLPDATLKVRGETIPGPLVYPFIAEKLPLLLGREAITGVNNVIYRPIYLPPLDVAGGMTIDPLQDTTVTTPNLPDVSVFVAAGTLEDQVGDPFTGTLSITEVPRELTPAALPDNLIPDIVVTIQPGEMVFTQPAPLTFPNNLAYPPGAMFDLWSINPITGVFDDVGDMRVSADGTLIETISGGIRNSSWHFTVNQPQQNTPGLTDQTRNAGAADKSCEQDAASTVNIRSCSLTESHTTPSYNSLGQARAVSLVYSADRVTSNHAFRFSTRVPSFFAGGQNYLGATLTISDNNSRFDVPSSNAPPEIGIENLHVWSPDSLSTTDELSAGLIVNTNLLANGIHNYTLSVGGFVVGATVSSVVTPLTGSFVKVSAMDSPYGTGWGIAGLQHIIETGDRLSGDFAQSVLIVDGDGSELAFRRRPDGSYQSPAGDFSTLTRHVDGTFERRTPEGMTYQFNIDHRLSTVADRHDNLTTFAYGAAGELISVTDPVGLNTTFSYAGGKLDAITLPDGRIIDVTVNANGDLTQIIDPDASTRTFEYDAAHRMTGEITPRGYHESIQYDQNGRVVQVTRRDGSILKYTPADVRGAYNPLTKTAQLLPPVFRDTNTSTYVTASGNVITSQLDRNGQVTRVSDSFGVRATYERNAFQQVTTATDWRGATTRFTYDALGNITSTTEEVSVQKAIFDSALNRPADGLAFPMREQGLTVQNFSTSSTVLDANGDGNPDIVAAGVITNGAVNSMALEVAYGDNAGGFAQETLIIPLWDASMPVLEMHSGDVNRDGNADLVMIRQEGATGALRVMLGDGNGNFTNASSLPILDLLPDFELADLNADNLLDVVGARSMTDELVIHYGIPGNSFAPATKIAVGDGPRDVAVGDVTGDGWVDLLVTNRLEDSISVLENNRAGGFISHPRVATDVSPTWIEIADFTGDSLPDFAVTFSGSTVGFRIYEGNGDGEFSALGATTPLTGSAQSMAVIDLAGDGSPDLFFALNTGTGNPVHVIYTNDGTGSVAETMTINGTGFGTYAVEDFNSDGYDDLMHFGNRAQVILQDRQGAVVTPSTIDVGLSPTDSVLTDFNGDGFLDLATTNSAANGVTVMLGDGNGQFLAPTNLAVGPAPSAISAHDVNKDEHLDLVLANQGNGTVTLLFGDGNGAFPQSTTLGTFPSGILDVAVGDMNNDSWPDIVAANYIDAEISIFYADTSGGFLPKSTFAWQNRPYSIELVDFNNDGLLDIGAAVQPSRFETRFNSGSGTFINPQSYDAGDPGSRSTALSVGDVNGDSYLDVAIVGEFDQGPFVFLGTSSGLFNTRINLTPFGEVVDSYAVQIADVNVDGFMDVVAADATFDRLSVYLGDGTGAFRPRTTFFTGDTPSSINVGDIDSDGRPDLLAANRNDNNVATLTTLPPPETVLLTQSFSYEPNFSRLTQYTDEEGRVFNYDIDPVNGNLLRATGPLGYSMSYTYTPTGLLDTETDALGRVTDYDYDALGRLTEVTFAVGTVDVAAVQYTYDAAGNVATFTDELGNVTEYFYDDLDRLVLERDALSFETEYTYDVGGNLLTVTDALNHVTSFTYDAMDRLVSVTDPLSNVTTYQYDAAGSLIAAVDPLGNTTRHAYDIAQRRTRSVDASGGIVEFRYDRSDNLTAVLDQARNRTSFFYDQRERLVREIDPLFQSTFYLYDGVNNLTRVRDRLTRQIAYAQDALDRTIQETWLDPINLEPVHTISYSYDVVGNLLSGTDTLSAMTYSYDNRDRVLTVDNLGTPKVPIVLLNYAYDAASNVLSVIDSINGVTSGTTAYTYDVLNRAETIQQSGADVSDKRVDYAYNPLSQLQSLTRFADLTATQKVATSNYAYDTANRLSSIQHLDATDALFAFYDYGYDASSRITFIDDIDGLTTYQYDHRHQLTLADRSPGDVRGDENYAYDGPGNRTASHLHGANYVNGTGNRLSSDGAYDYLYDAEGNLRVRTEIATGATRHFEWDHRNRLIAVEDRDNVGTPILRVTFTYDAFDRRIAKTVDNAPNDTADGTTEFFVYDREDVILDFADADGSGPQPIENTQRYFHGPGIDEILAQEASIQESVWLFADHLGTVRDLVATNGQSNHVEFDSFGNVISNSNPSLQSRYGFTGREFDAETKLYYYRARFLNTETGRFLREDPVRLFGTNGDPFSYALNSPTTFSDPSGEIIPALLWGLGFGLGFLEGIGLYLGIGEILDDVERIARENIAGSCGNLADNLLDLMGDIALLGLGRGIAWGASGLLRALPKGMGSGLLNSGTKSFTAPKSTTWPRTANEMDDFLGVPGQRIPDGPTTLARDKTVWHPNADTKITLERHPYHPDAPDWHRDYHWHLDTPNNPHQRFLPGDEIPGLGGGGGN